jgi:hypothetical protein
MNPTSRQFESVNVIPAGSKPRTKGAGTEPYGAPYRERLADKVNSSRGGAMPAGASGVTRPKPGSAYDGGSY